MLVVQWLRLIVNLRPVTPEATAMSVPAKPPSQVHPPPELIEFWNQVQVSDELGGTFRKELEFLERRVTECLAQKPPDVLTAVRLTVDALDLIAGRNET